MNRKLVITLTAMPLILISILGAIPVFAGTGSIRIDPPLPEESIAPATFEIWIKGSDLAECPHAFLVMTQSSYNGLSGDVTVSWNGDYETATTWTMETENGKKIPPGTTNGAGYTVSALKDHLDTSDPIYWTIVPILDGATLGPTHVEITVTLPSSDPDMLVYIIGKSDCEGSFDERVPPTIPGFVVPEIPLGTISGVISMLGALLLMSNRKNVFSRV